MCDSAVCEPCAGHSGCRGQTLAPFVAAHTKAGRDDVITHVRRRRPALAALHISAPPSQLDGHVTGGVAGVVVVLLLVVEQQTIPSLSFVC